MERVIKNRNLRELLFHLGVTANHLRFFHTAAAVQLAMEEPRRMTLVTKLLYPDVAKYFHTTWRAVEKNIREASEDAWRDNPDLLRQIAGYDIPERPTAAEFVSILTKALYDISADEDE